MPCLEEDALDLHGVKSLPGFLRWLSAQFWTSALPETWGSVVASAAWSAAVVALYKYVDSGVAISSSLLSVLGLLLSFIVSLRANAGYERYLEGRKLFATLSLACRNTSHLLWIHERVKPADDATPDEVEDAELRLMLQKRTILNLVAAYPIAVKHHLRGEQGPYHADLYPLIACLPRRAGDSEHDVSPVWQNVHAADGAVVIPLDAPTTEEPVEMLRDDSASSKLGKSTSTVGWTEKLPKQPTPARRDTTTIDLAPAYNPPKRSVYDYLPLLVLFRPIAHFVFNVTRDKEEDLEHDRRKALRKQRKFQALLTSNIPLELSLTISSYIANANRRGSLSEMYTGQVLTSFHQLQDTFANLERILQTPLPHNYVLHLSLILFIWFVLLPFQIVSTFGWLSIAFSSIASFFFFGCLSVGAALENPFGYDHSDLDLDGFCAVVRREIAEITAHRPFDPADFLADPLNAPFASTGDMRTAAEILETRGDRTAALRRTLNQAFQAELRTRVTATRKVLRKARGKVVVTTPSASRAPSVADKLA